MMNKHMQDNYMWKYVLQVESSNFKSQISNTHLSLKFSKFFLSKSHFQFLNKKQSIKNYDEVVFHKIVPRNIHHCAATHVFRQGFLYLVGNVRNFRKVAMKIRHCGMSLLSLQVSLEQTIIQWFSTLSKSGSLPIRPQVIGSI